MGISVVNAMDYNSTDELMTSDMDEVISVVVDDSEVLIVEDMENDVISVDDEDSVNQDDVISASNADVLNVENTENELSVISDDVLAAQNNEENLSAVDNNSTMVLAGSEPPSDVPMGNPIITHSSNLKLEKLSKLDTMVTKEMVFAKIKISKKDFKRFVLKTPSKKNKKLWKKYKKFIKSMNKKYKKSKNKKIKSIKKKWKIDWYYGIRPVFVLKGKFCTLYWICMCYKYI